MGADAQASDLALLPRVSFKVIKDETYVTSQTTWVHTLSNLHSVLVGREST